MDPQAPGTTRMHALLLACVHTALRLPFVQDVPEYYDSLEYADRSAGIDGGWWSVLANGHLPHQALLLAPARLLLGLLPPAAALSVVSVLYGLGATLAFHRFLLRLVTPTHALAGTLLLVLMPFNALSDLSGYSVSLVMCFFLVTLVASTGYLQGAPSTPRALVGVGLAWFLAVSGHLLIGMWSLAVPAVWLLVAGPLRHDVLRRMVALSLCCVLATVASLMVQAHFVTVQFPGIGIVAGVRRLVLRDGAGPYALGPELVVRAVQMVGAQWGVVPGLGVTLLCLRIPVPLRRRVAVLALLAVGFLAAAKMFHWGLCTRVVFPGTVLMLALAVLAASRLRPRWQGLLWALVVLQFSVSSTHVLAERLLRPLPMAALQGAVQPHGDARVRVITPDRQRPFSAFPPARTVLYNEKADNPALLDLVHAKRRGELARVLMDSQTFYHPHWLVDGWFYAYDATYTGVGPVTGQRSSVAEVIAQVDYRYLALVPGRQFVVALDEPMQDADGLRAVCPKGMHAGFVRVTGLTPGARVDVYSRTNRLSPLRWDAMDLYAVVNSRVGGPWDPLAWSYAGASGVAVAAVFDPPDDLQVYVDKQPYTEFGWVRCPP
ncbi:MAG: hypothetical protein AB2A00_03200 [Myxococcota bacterium]